MGWSSGSELFDVVIDVLQPNITDFVKRVKAYKKLIHAFRDQDWDTENECEGKDPAFDEALRRLDIE